MPSAVLNPSVSAMSWFMDVTDDDGALVAEDPWYRWRLLSNLAAFSLGPSSGANQCLETEGMHCPTVRG
jgi:hypothetical protein